MNRVYWDSMLFIYLLEANPTYGKIVTNIYKSMQRRNDVLCTSVFTLGEVLTGPRKLNDLTGIHGIKQFFGSDALEMLPFTEGVADRYSMIRAQGNVSPADAIQLAIAAEFGIQFFITHDKKLQKLSIPGIHFIIGMDGRIF